MTWVRAYAPGQFPGDPNSQDGTDVMFAVSRNGGQTWQTRLQTEPATGEPGNVQETVIQEQYAAAYGIPDDQGNAGQGYIYYPQVSIGPQGDLYVSTWDGGCFTVFHSLDNGASFTQPNFGTGLGILQYQAAIVPVAHAVPGRRVRRQLPDPSAPRHRRRSRAIPAGSTLPRPSHTMFSIITRTWRPRSCSPIPMTTARPGSSCSRSAARRPTWRACPPTRTTLFMSVLNDDDNGNFTLFDSPQQYAQEVVAGHALPSLAVDAQGQVTVVWYDTRDDPLNSDLDVFGTVSNDGGQNFSANFRSHDTPSTPPPAPSPTRRADHDYLGDRIGLVAVNGVAYAVWTDTRNGSQDIYLQKYSLDQPPAPPLDRFYPDNTPATATGLGQVTAQRRCPG